MSNASSIVVADEENVAQLARAFFSAATKESPDDEDILPQVNELIFEIGSSLSNFPQPCSSAR
jgi:hypothetical protein